MRAFTFRLETLLHLREMAKEKAVKEYAHSIAIREKTEKQLMNAVKELKDLNLIIGEKRRVGFSGFEQETFNQSVLKAKEHIIDLNSKVSDRKNIEEAKRKLFLEADTNCKSLLKLKDKKKEEHLKIEIKKEETALEDVIGARFVFNQSTN